MPLPEHRQSIDELDTQIVKLLNERTKHVLAIGAIKRKSGDEIYAPHRERAVLNRIVKRNPGPLTNDGLRAIYREVMSASLALEKSLTVAYFGPEATFTHQAALRRFGGSLNYTALKTIGDVFAEVSRRRADYGVVPVENSTEGVVTHTLDMFVESELKIVSQLVMPIQHCLVSRTTRDKVKKVFSHPQALAQCRGWVREHLPQAEIVEASSTTRAAELAAAETGAAAIASALASERYRLDILASDIQDNPGNATRFLVLGRTCPPATGNDRTSLMVGVAHKVGALHSALAAFRRHRINMTKIESRPSKRRAWEYFFFIDVDGHETDPKVAKALRLLGDHCNFVKILGSYPRNE